MSCTITPASDKAGTLACFHTGATPCVTSVSLDSRWKGEYKYTGPRIGVDDWGETMINTVGPRRATLTSMLAGMLLVSTVATAPSADAVVVGVCTIKVNDPHGSVHVQGTINATGTVSCTMTMDEIYVRVQLERADGMIVRGRTKDYFNTAYQKANAATSCSNSGTWRARVHYVLRAPAGVNPSYAANNFASPWKSVACGLSTPPMDSSVNEQKIKITVPAASSGSDA